MDVKTIRWRTTIHAIDRYIERSADGRTWPTKEAAEKDLLVELGIAQYIGKKPDPTRPGAENDIWFLPISGMYVFSSDDPSGEVVVRTVLSGDYAPDRASGNKRYADTVSTVRKALEEARDLPSLFSKLTSIPALVAGLKLTPLEQPAPKETPTAPLMVIIEHRIVWPEMNALVEKLAPRVMATGRLGQNRVTCRPKDAANKAALKRARREKGLSQTAAARCLGISLPTYRRMEAGTRPTLQADIDRVLAGP